MVLVLQGMDAAGKDGTIRRVLTGLNPQGCSVVNFKAPTEVDLAHDYLWRVHAAAPARGILGVWNRSHYEDVVAARVRRRGRRRAVPQAATATSASSSACCATRAPRW